LGRLVLKALKVPRVGLDPEVPRDLGEKPTALQSGSCSHPGRTRASAHLKKNDLTRCKIRKSLCKVTT
jgi:hypothetical protein